MRLVIQRVSEASVSIDGKVIGKIRKGLFVLVGVGKEDNEKKAEELAEKLSKLRVMADKNGKMNLSVNDVGAKILAVSQFTLYGNTRKGNRPSFVNAAEPGKAEKIYNHFIEKLKEKGIEVETGSFGDYMTINTKLDGPVTIIME
jgi:D-tyrosyl-tRNA(Tyr) deacylase